MKVYEELVARGLIAQVTNETEIREMVNNGKATFYIGFDCTADSLTAGHFMALVLMIVSAIILHSFGVGESANQEAIDKSIAKYGILHILTVCIFGSVVEEVFYRGILFEALKGKEGNTIRGVFAVVLTSLLFAIAHVSVIGFTVDDLLANIPVFMLGLSITALYFKTDNIICSILLHIIINSYATLG